MLGLGQIGHCATGLRFSNKALLLHELHGKLQRTGKIIFLPVSKKNKEKNGKRGDRDVVL